MPLHCLVIGGNGFIGSHVVDKLLGAGHRVRVVDLYPERFREPLPGVDYRMHGLSNIEGMASALEGVDVVVHLVSTTVPSSSNDDPVADVNGNLVATLVLLDLMREKGVSKVIYLSSGGTVYGVPKQVPIPEAHALQPLCSYGVVKVAVENYLNMYESLYGLKPVVLRASNPYGPRQPNTGLQGVIAAFLSKMLSGEVNQIWGDGSVIRDFIYVEDLADLVLSAVSAEPFVTGVFNAGSGVGSSVNDVANAIELVTGKSCEREYISGRAYDVPKVVLDITAASEAFAWAPTTSLANGITKAWSWLGR